MAFTCFPCGCWIKANMFTHEFVDIGFCGEHHKIHSPHKTIKEMAKELGKIFVGERKDNYE